MALTSRYGRLPLPDSPRVRVFREIEDIIRAAPELKFLKREAIQTYAGNPWDKNELAIGLGACISMVMAPADIAFFYPGAMKGPLYISFNLLIPGYVQDDLDNLWWAIFRALNPESHADADAMRVRLQAAGADTGLINIPQPAYSPLGVTQEGGFRGVGQIAIDVVDNLLRR